MGFHRARILKTGRPGVALDHISMRTSRPPPPGQPRLSDDKLAQIRSWYRGAVAKGITDNQNRRTRQPVTGCGWPADSATTRT
jgi:hypothetical protein